MCLSKMHHQDNWELRVEELTIIINQRVAMVLNPRATIAWHTAGAKVLPWSGHHLVVPFTILGHADPLFVVAAYHLTGIHVDERSAIYNSAQGLFLYIKSMTDLQLWTGDFNAHAGADGTGAFLVDKLLPQATTKSGAAHLAWISLINLRYADSFHSIKYRGTWQHSGGSWYEIDQVWATPLATSAIHHVRTTNITITDHRGKVYNMCFPKVLGKQAAVQRKLKFQAQ